MSGVGCQCGWPLDACSGLAERCGKKRFHEEVRREAASGSLRAQAEDVAKRWHAVLIQSPDVPLRARGEWERKSPQYRRAMTQAAAALLEADVIQVGTGLHADQQGRQ